MRLRGRISDPTFKNYSKPLFVCKFRTLFFGSGDQFVASWFYLKRAFLNTTFRAVNHISKIYIFFCFEWVCSRPNIAVILRPLFVCLFNPLLFRRSRNWSLKRWEALSLSTVALSQTSSGNMSGSLYRTICTVPVPVWKAGSGSSQSEKAEALEGHFLSIGGSKFEEKLV